MGSNAPPKRRLPINFSMPGGYFLGRASSGEGDIELVSLGKAQSVGLIPSKMPPTGPAGGDLSGTYPNPTVAAIQGYSVKSVAPTDGYVLTWVAADNEWEPKAASGGAIPSSYWLDGSGNYYVALVDSNAELVLDSHGYGVYDENPPLPIKGVVDASSAAAGFVGEILSATVALGSAVSLSNSIAKDITTLALTPGDWDVWGTVAASPTTVTGLSIVRGWISTASAMQPSSFITGMTSFDYGSTGISASSDSVIPIPVQQINVSTNTTIYLTARVFFSGGSEVGYGSIYARRRR